MLRRLETKESWRSLDRGFWPDDLPAGCRTVVYGHNGSGKSTLSELLLDLAEGTLLTDVVWENDQTRTTEVRVGDSSPRPYLSVFTRKWVEANLRAFLDGDSAAAIVTLGRTAIDAKEEEDRLTTEVEKLNEQVQESKKQRDLVNRELETLARAVQDQIVSQLKAYDADQYTRHRFSLPRVQEELRSFQGDFPSEDSYTEALRRLGDAAPETVDCRSLSPSDIAEKLVGLSEFLADTPTRVAITDLEGNARVQSWVENGLTLHNGLARCHFCDNEISEERRAALSDHFDESWLQIRSRAKSMLDVVCREQLEIEEWLTELPPAIRLVPSLQNKYSQILNKIRTDANSRLNILGSLESAIEVKAADPSETPTAPRWSALSTAVSTTALEEIIGEHNNQARRHEELAAERMSTILNHLIGSQCKKFQRLEKQAKELESDGAANRELALQVGNRLFEVRQAQFTTKDMADTLTRDLARVYGKGHLSVAVTNDGKSFSCRRGDKPGTDLSEGERTTLSLLYFLRKLEDEQGLDCDPSQRIVVIDDPSSSLDREALFATHQLLNDTLSKFGQYIVLTHDFSLLRLFLKSQNNAWGKSMKRATQDADELRYPKVSFLEMYASTVSGQRRSKLGKLPRLLLNSTSEYAYLFSTVMGGVAGSSDHDHLFLLPNAARRVLEVFASYKAPHHSDFLPALASMVNEQEGEPFRDVYDFCNRYSHGEGTEIVDLLDARAVHRQISRCMEFLRTVDPVHYQRMCKATGVDPDSIFKLDR